MLHWYIRDQKDGLSQAGRDFVSFEEFKSKVSRLWLFIIDNFSDTFRIIED